MYDEIPSSRFFFAKEKQQSTQLFLKTQPEAMEGT
jgi:hypothetical protein